MRNRTLGASASSNEGSQWASILVVQAEELEASSDDTGVNDMFRNSRNIGRNDQHFALSPESPDTDPETERTNPNFATYPASITSFISQLSNNQDSFQSMRYSEEETGAGASVNNTQAETVGISSSLLAVVDVNSTRDLGMDKNWKQN